jgi:hypothetical protein
MGSTKPATPQPYLVNNVFIEINGNAGFVKLTIKETFNANVKIDRSRQLTTYNKLKQEILQDNKLSKSNPTIDEKDINKVIIDNYRDKNGQALYSINEVKDIKNPLFSNSINSTFRNVYQGQTNIDIVKQPNYTQYEFKLNATTNPQKNKIKLGNSEWTLNPSDVTLNTVNNVLEKMAIDAKLDKDTEGFSLNQSIIKISFGPYETKGVSPGSKRTETTKLPPPVIIALEGITEYTRGNGTKVSLLGKNPRIIVDYVKAALRIKKQDGTVAQTPIARGGALMHIDDTMNNLPYILALQDIWEQKHNIYKNLEPKYQQMLPAPEPSPIEELQEPFHRYMDTFGDQDILEDARMTIGLKKPEEIDYLFENDDDEINELYRKALPDIDEKLIPSFVRIDMVRLLS